jgi:hypothetical protein
VTPYEHIPHPRVQARKAEGPVKVADQHPTGSAVTRFNTRLALGITKVVGSMWCAYAFALFDLLSLKTAIDGGIGTIVAWIAQTFLQLVLLSIIMVGQNVQAAAADKRAEQTYFDAEAILHGQGQLAQQLADLGRLLAECASGISAPAPGKAADAAARHAGARAAERMVPPAAAGPLPEHGGAS